MTSLSIECNCGRIITATSPSMLEYNYETHMKSKRHKRELMLRKKYKVKLK